MLWEVAKDIRAFMVIFLYQCLAYSFLYFHLDYGDDYYNYFHTGFLLALGYINLNKIN